MIEKISRQQKDSLSNELPKNRLQKSLEVGREVVSLLHELGDVIIEEASALQPSHVIQSSIPALCCAHTPKATARATESRCISKFRTPLRQANATTNVVMPNTHCTDCSNDSSLHSDSPVAVCSPLNTSTPTSAARRYIQKSIKGSMMNNSMDDSDFDVILAETAGNLSKMVEEKSTEPKSFNLRRQQLLQARPLNNSMDDPDTNHLIVNLTAQPVAPSTSTISTALYNVNNKENYKKEDDVMIIEPNMSCKINDLKPVRAALTPKLRRHASHTIDVSSSPTSSRPGQMVESARRMRRHRSLIDELRAIDITSTATVNSTTVNNLASLPSPAFNSTLVKPSTLQRYKNKEVQQTLPGTIKTNDGITSTTKLVHDDSAWLCSRKSPAISPINDGIYAPKISGRAGRNQLVPIKNTSMIGRKRPNPDSLRGGVVVNSGNYQMPLKRLPLHENVDPAVSTSKKPTMAITTADGFISKKVISQIVSSQKASNKPFAPSLMTTSAYVPPKDDSFYDDDIEFSEILISS